MWKLFMSEDVNQFKELQHSGPNCCQTGHKVQFKCKTLPSNEIMLFCVLVSHMRRGTCLTEQREDKASAELRQKKRC